MSSTELAASPSAWLRRLSHYLYLADLVRGKRVLEVGCGTGIGAQFLADRGATRVVGIDRSSQKVNEARARHRQSNLEFRCEHPGAVELEDASFDCIFVAEGLEVLRRRSVLVELRRLLAPGGTLVLCGASADRRGALGGATFHEFRERLERSFPPVRMIAQAPFLAFSLIEYGDPAAAPELHLDTSLCDAAGEVAEACDYVAVCGGAADAPLRGFTVVQVPNDCHAAVVAAVGPTAVAPPVVAAPDPKDGPTARELRLRLERTIEERARAQTQAAQLQAELAELRRQVAAGPGDTEAGAGAEADGERATASEQIASALVAHQEAVRGHEAAVEEARAYADELRAELEQVTARGEELDGARRSAEERAERLEAELRGWRDRAATAEGALLRLSLDGPTTAVAGPTVAAEPAAVSDAGALLVRPAAGDVPERLGRLEAAVGGGRDLLRHIEEGLAELERAARDEAERPATAWGAHRDQQLRDLAGELGIKDAEITILHVGISALRARLKEIIGEVRRAAGSMHGRSAPEMLAVMERLKAHLAAFEERD